MLYKQSRLQTSVRGSMNRKKKSCHKHNRGSHVRRKGPEELQKVPGPVKYKKAKVVAHSTPLETTGQLTFQHGLTVSQVNIIGTG